MQLLTLDCGRQVWLSSFAYSGTYSGLFDGRPTPEINAWIIGQALTYESWGSRKTYLIPPETDASDPKHPVLPPALLRVWLWCSDSIDPEFHGSELVVVWFASECLDQPIEETVYRAVRGLKWDELAQDFLW